MVTLNRQVKEYVDLDFIFGAHPVTSNLYLKKSINSVKQSIMHLLRLRTGDKPFHPEIKSPIYDFLFESPSVIVQVVLEGEIKKYLNVYEPRVIVHTVNVSFPNPNAVSCDIVGEIINTEEAFTVKILVDRLR